VESAKDDLLQLGLSHDEPPIDEYMRCHVSMSLFCTQYIRW